MKMVDQAVTIGKQWGFPALVAVALMWAAWNTWERLQTYSEAQTQYIRNELSDLNDRSLQVIERNTQAFGELQKAIETNTDGR